MSEPIRIRGELYVTLETVAQWYEVEVSWVKTVYEWDVLGSGQVVGSTLAIAVSRLDRVAQIRRLQLQTGLDLPGVISMLGFFDQERLGEE